jgi:hypothetical protein
VKNVLLLLVLFLALGLIVGCGDDSPAGETTEIEFIDPMAIPENVAAMDNILAIVTELGERLNAEDGYYGDLHDIIVANGNRQGPEHMELWEIIYAMRIETGATYVYSFIDGGGEYNQIIVDGLDPEDMDPYGFEYEKEPWTIEAFRKGEPTVAQDAWMDEYGEGLQKSGFAPIFNSDGEISFLLGLDYPVPELEQHEELWNY